MTIDPDALEKAYAEMTNLHSYIWELWIFRVVKWDKHFLSKLANRAIKDKVLDYPVTFCGLRIFSGLYIGFMNTRGKEWNHDRP